MDKTFVVEIEYVPNGRVWRSQPQPISELTNWNNLLRNNSGMSYMSFVDENGFTISLGKELLSRSVLRLVV